jgi:hypothetical protein
LCWYDCPRRRRTTFTQHSDTMESCIVTITVLLTYLVCIFIMVDVFFLHDVNCDNIVNCIKKLSLYFVGKSTDKSDAIYNFRMLFSDWTAVILSICSSLVRQLIAASSNGFLPHPRRANRTAAAASLSRNNIVLSTCDGVRAGGIDILSPYIPSGRIYQRAPMKRHIPTMPEYEPKVSTHFPVCDC